MKNMSSVLRFLFLLFATVSAQEDPEFRLPSSITPISYEVILHPNYPTGHGQSVIEVTDFWGKVEIIVEVEEDTNSIYLHIGNNVIVDQKKISIRDHTEEPDTEDPGTEVPNTDDPGTDDPNTEDPNTDDPGTDDPNTDDPNTDDPNTDDPNTDDPNTDDPNTDDPNTDDPNTDDPNTDDPNTDDPYTDDPNTEDPNTEDPNTDDPNTDDPNTEDPNTDDPNTDDPNTDDPNTDEANTDDPGTDDPGTDDPGTDDPGTDDPGTDDSGTDDPGTDDPGTDDPGTDDPGTYDPGTDDPNTEDPSTDDPNTDHPGTDDPVTDDPNTEDPNTDDPGTDDPNTEDPNTDDPGTDDPNTEDPNTEDPNTEDPDTEDPGTENPDTEEPSTDDTFYTIESQEYNGTTQINRISLGETLTKGQKIKISMEFTGKLETDMYGFYKSTYSIKNNEGEEELRMLLTTQFQSTHARKAFPCFDEPKFKAKFKVSLLVPDGYAALSNTAKDESSTDTLITFKETVTMSTYLLAFIIYEKESFGPSIVVVGSDDVRLTSWGRSSAMEAHLGDYSQTVTYKILSELDEFTGIPYSTDGVMMKVDQAAIPDFSSGAMENWGLVTYRETGLLFDELNNTEATRKSVAAVIAHELTHQWFGNLVTMDWWSSTWLNEGFARFFQYFILDKIYPQWRMMEQLVVDQQMSVFATDALVNAVPLFRDVNTQSEIDGQFSSAAYSKGGCVVRILSIVMGPEHFQKGLQQYLKEREFKTATAEQLFEALNKNKPPELEPEQLPEGFEFTDLITWSTTPGYPVVTFTRDSVNKKVTIKQERFFLEATTNPSETLYPVYLEWTTSDGSHAKLWLVQREISSSEALPKSDDGWFIVSNTGYFRVDYDVQNWRNLFSQLWEKDLQRIAPLDRATLVDNILNLARVDRISYQFALGFLRYLQNETDYIPWNAAFNGFNFLHRMLVNVDDLGLFNNYVRTLSQGVYNYLGFQDKGDHLEKIHRANTLSWACRVGVEDCHARAVDLLTAYIDQGKRVPANLRSVAYCYGIKSGSSDLWLKMWQKLQENEDASERSLLISALGCSKSYTTLYLYLEQSLSGEVIRQQDASSVFSSVYTNPEGVDVALDFLTENFDRIEQTYVSMNALRNVVTGLANYLTTEEQRVKMANLVNDKPESLEGIGTTALATIDTNLLWLQKYKDEVLTTITNILSKENVEGDLVEKTNILIYLQ